MDTHKGSLIYLINIINFSSAVFRATLFGVETTRILHECFLWTSYQGYKGCQIYWKPLETNISCEPRKLTAILWLNMFGINIKTTLRPPFKGKV